MRIGILALQGAFREHRLCIERCGVRATEIRRPHELAAVQGLIIPGGESTSIGRLLGEEGLGGAIVERARQGMPVWGTCAGLILLAKNIVGYPQQCSLKLMDITVVRNAFGRQVDSFESDIEVPVLGEQPFRAVFIRAPYIVEVGAGVEVLSRYEGKVVMARQGHMLACAFHPELTDDLRIHRYFLSLCAAGTGK
ncbi:MAG: pyridoxal 5'-phosphate synthase glutaminase subunit PdxT [Clostridia bacterium]|nr:pyridoxal 5'-phosphate synthase glutaminase subunit PdxT [Clostridia bacterium]